MQSVQANWWKRQPKKVTENSDTQTNHCHITSTNVKSSPSPTPVWMNHLPVPEILPPGGDMLVKSTAGCGSGFRWSILGNYLDTGTYF